MNQEQTLFRKMMSQKIVDNKLSPRSLRSSRGFKILIILGTIVICGLFFIVHLDEQVEDNNKFKLIPGYVWSGQSINADFTYPIYKSNNDYQSELLVARTATPLVFLLDQTKDGVLIEIVNKISDSLKTITIESNKNLDAPISDKVLQEFLSLSPSQRQNELQKLRRVLASFIDDIYRNGFVNVNLEKINHSEITAKVPPNREFPLLKSGLNDRGSYLTKLRQFVASELPKTSPIAFEILSKYSQPNLVYSEELTEKAKQIAEKSVPKTSGIVRENEIVIKKGDVLTKEIIPRIRSYQTSRQMRSDESVTALSILGSLGHSTVIYSILLLYIFFIRKKIFADNFQIVILSASLVLVSLMAWITVEISSSFPIEYLIFLPAFSMLTAIIFDSRTAFYATVTMALMIAGIRGNDYGTGTAMLFAGTLGAYTVRDIQSRTQMFRSIFYIFIGLAFATVMFGLERSLDIYILGSRVLFSLVNAALAPIITFGALFIIERVSSVSTDLRIKEYDNLNHPLLLKMNETAPGTYQHTLAVALLAERCAQAIGANPLLSKVGTYFHDIGKMAKAEYFTENQMEMGNKHDLLQPKKSAATIREHIVDGIELARQYKLPERLIDFIPMHHGTSLIKHFYAKALEAAHEKGLEVNENDYRYPGPKPNSKETAILMICDSAEAISRIENMDNDSIKAKINDTIEDKILDGQFDNSNLTFEDVRKIKDTIFKNIIAKSHKRTSYKEMPQAENN